MVDEGVSNQENISTLHVKVALMFLAHVKGGPNLVPPRKEFRV